VADDVLDLQLAPWAARMLTPSRYKGAHGGRASGKSHTFALLLLLKLIRDPSARAICLREFQNSLAESSKQLLEDKIKALGLDGHFRVMRDRIECTQGSGHIVFRGLSDVTADSVKSMEAYDVAWIEEAQTISQRSLNILRPTIRKPGSEIWATWNPVRDTDPIEQLLRAEGGVDDAIVVEVNYTDNPWLPDVIRQEIERDSKRDPDKFAHVWLGRYAALSSRRIFKNWRVEEFETPPNAPRRGGADWGFAQDPTTLVTGWIDGRTLYVDHEAYGVGVDIVDTPDLFLQVPGAEKIPIVADGSRPETISHMRKHGFSRITAAVKGPGSVEDGIKWLQSLDIVVHPRCTNTIRELADYAWKVDKRTDTILAVPEDKDNHTIDALRYMCEGARRIQASARPVVVAAPPPTAHRW